MKAVTVFIVAVFALSILAITQAEAIDIYTFKKDRIDQEISGNQGYLSGQPKNGPEKKRNLKRTLIGVDVEIGAGGGSEKEEPVATEERQEKYITEKRSKTPQNVTVVEKETYEEEYIK